MPSCDSSEISARPTATVPPVIFRTSPGFAPIRNKSAGASRAIAWPTSSTRASETRSVTVVPAHGVEFWWFERLSAGASGGAKGPPVMSSRKSGNLVVLKSKFCSSYLTVPTAASLPACSYSCERASSTRGEKSPAAKYSLPEQHFFDVFDVPPHGQLRSFGIMAVQRGKDFPVACQRFLRTSVNLQTAFA